MRRSRLQVFVSLIACLAWALLACFSRPCHAEGGEPDLAAGIAARSARPPDVTAARAHFEAAATAADERVAADALFNLAELDDEGLEFARAVERYEASAARSPSGRHTPRARGRAHELRVHSEDAYRPLVRLERVRRSADLADDLAVIDALARDADTFPPGKVRAEARLLVAEAYLGRLHRTADAIPVLRLVVDDPRADVLMARAAASHLLQTYVGRGDLDSALELARSHAKMLEPLAARNVERTMRRHPLRLVAWGDLSLLVVLAALALRRPDRRAIWDAVRDLAPLGVVFSLFACGVGGLLASRYEQTNPYPFAAMVPVVLGVILLARAASAGGAEAALVRASRAVVAFASVFAAAFLMLDRMDPVYLQGFGL